MKPAMLIPLFLVVAAVAPSAVCAQDPVLDIDGDTVVPNVQYYIDTMTPEVHVSHSKEYSGMDCPRIAVLTSLAAPFYQPGTPVMFFPEGGRTYVPVSTDLSVQFSAESWPCDDESKVWKLNPNSPTMTPDIRTDGVIGGEGSNTFTIEHLEGSTYNFVYCNAPSSGCTDIGVFIGLDGTQRLGASLTPLVVTFRKALPPV